jgi:cytochrome o ubiquinol oxidase subunit II
MRLERYSNFLKLLCLGGVVSLAGCDAALLDPKGAIGVEQRSLIITATVLMLIVVIPVIVMTFLFAWRYRASNNKATYDPEWAHSNKIEAVVWTIPCIIILVLGTITYKTTKELDPRNPIVADVKPIVIEAISLDWKWLFIYPELGIASVNQIAFPVGVPVEFKVTSNTVMNSFFIPRLGSQIYAMAGMQNRVHLIANEAGVYDGISANYSGAGFSGMKFTAEATTQQGFEEWVANVRLSQDRIDSMADFEHIAVPSENNPVAHFSHVKKDLYQSIIDKFMGTGMSGHMHSHSSVGE